MPWILVMLYLVLSRYWYRTFIQTYSATSPLKSTLGNGQNYFAKLLSKLNNLRGSGSGRIFALLLPQQEDRFHRFRFQLPLPHPWLQPIWSTTRECVHMHISNDKWLATSIRIFHKNGSALLDSISISELCSVINSTVATVHESFTSQH